MTENGSGNCELISEPLPVSTTDSMSESLPVQVPTIEKPDDDNVLAPNDNTNETSSNCTESAEGAMVQENEKEDDDSVDFLRSPRIHPSSPTTTTTNSSTNPKRFSADAAAQAQLHALTRETYTMSLRQLRQERLSWRRDKLELEHLRSVVLAGGSSAAAASGDDGDGSGGAYNPLSTNSQIQSLLQEKVHNEELLEACNDEIEALKEQLHSLRTEHRDLKKELAQTQQELHEERSRQEQEEQELQQQQLENGHKDDHHVPRARISRLSINQASTVRRIQDLEEQIHKWEVLYFESAEMGERQIQRLEEEVEQLRDELEQAREEQANANNNNNDDSKDEAIAKLEEELQQWRNRVEEMEQEMLLQKELFETKINSSQNLDEKWELQVLSLSKLLLPDDAEPETFANRLAALAEEMDKAESLATKTKRQHDAELSSSPEMTQTSNIEQPDTVHPTISTLQQEPETQIPVIIQEEDSYSDESRSSSGDGDIEQYVADLEKRVESNVAQNLHLNELLNQERIVAKNREDGLRKQLVEARDLIDVATNREAILTKELAELKENMASAEKKHDMVVEDLQNQLRRAQDESSRSQELVKELRQKLELARQAQILLSESATNDTSTKSSEWEKERLELQRQIESQQLLLDDAKRRIDATQRENSQLRHVKDSLMGIDREMEELIESLEPLQNELAEQTKQAKEARDEVEFLKQELVREMARRPEFEREIKTLKDEIARTKGQLNQVYIDLKNEQAAHETEIEEMKAESTSLKESLEYYKSSLEIMQEAMHEVNEDIRKSSPSSTGIMDQSFTILEKENKMLRGDNDKLKNQISEIRKSMEANSLGMQTELKSLRQKLVDLESEMDALEMEASMAIQERDALEERLQASHVMDDRQGTNQFPASHDINTTLGNLNEIDQLLQEIDEVRIQATQKQEATELKIRKLEAELQLERNNASLVIELKKQIKRLEADTEKTTPKVSDQKARTKKAHHLEDQQGAVASKDAGLGRKDSEQQGIPLPVETEESSVQQKKSEDPSQQRLSVKDMVRSRDSTAQSTPTLSTIVTHDLEDGQATEASKHVGTSVKDSEQQCIPPESEESLVRQQKSGPPSQKPLSVKDIIRSKESTEQKMPTLSKTVTHNLNDQQATIASKDVVIDRKDSEQQCIALPVETEESSARQQKSGPPSQQRSSVKDIVRSKDSTAQNMPTSSTIVTHGLEDVQATEASKDVGTSVNESEQHCTPLPVETEESSVRQQKSQHPSQQRLSVKDIIRSKESTEQNTPPLPKLRKEEAQRPSISVKDLLQNFQK